jgi:hypothetical protein
MSYLAISPATDVRDASGQHTCDPAAYLPKLRAEFPRWGCLYAIDRRGDWGWVAVHGLLEIWACSGIELRERLLAAANTTRR